MTERRITATELDAILAELTPEVHARLTKAASSHADQIEAAQAESIRLLECLEDRRVLRVARSSVEDWIRLGVLDTFIGWADGSGRTCRHMPDYRRPEPLFACAWRQRLVVCLRCVGLLKVTGDAAFTCDCCGRRCPEAEGIYAATVWFGVLAYDFGACTDCWPAAISEDEASA